MLTVPDYVAEQQRRFDEVNRADRPQWLAGCSTRLWNGLCWVYACSELQAIDPDLIRARGRQALLRQPNLGVVSINELERFIGGWEFPPQPPHQTLEQRLMRIEQMLELIVARLRC